MIISRAEIQSAVAAYRSGVKRVTAVVPVTVDALDTFAASEESASLGSLRDAVAEKPYYRERLVNELRRRIAEGKYFVPSEQLVEQLLGRLFVESLGRSGDE